MSQPFGEPNERGENRFKNPQEELEHLRAQVVEKERQLTELGHTGEREAAAYDEIQKYKEAPTEEVLHESHRITDEEVSAVVLDLPPDDDDKVMQELLGVLQEKGIKNSLRVAAQLANPHLEDDYHRVLVQYVAHGYPINDLQEKAGLWNVLNMTLFEITLPEPGSQEEERPLKELVSAMESFYMGMFSIDDKLNKFGDRYFTLEVAVSGEREDIVFYMAVPNDKEGLFEKQLLSIFPKARVHHAPNDYNIFLHEGKIAAATAAFKYEPILPLKDYNDFEQDPLAVLINTLTKVSPVGEGIAVQYIVNPVGSMYMKRYGKILDKLEKGMTLRDAIKDTPEGFGGEVLKTFRDFIKTEVKKTENERFEEQRIDQPLIEEVRKKLSTLIVSVNIRLIASAATEERADTMLLDVISSFNQFYNTSGNRLRFDRARGKEALVVAKRFTFREYVNNTALPLSVRELTTLMHFPTHAIAGTPQLKRARAADAPAPIGLPTAGTLLGTNEYRGAKTGAYLTEADRLRHLYVIGQTGTGKSVFLKNLILQDMERGDGVCFIDPHGTDIEDVLTMVPEHRMKDIIYFDPADTENVLGLNMLEYDERRPDQKTFVINELFSIFQKLYSGSPESMGPAFEQYFRNATALVLEDPATGSTMLDISRVLADAKYREVKLSRSQNPVVNQFWREIATKAQGEASLQNIVPYITNKFDIFTANDIVRPIIAQQTSAFNMRDIMDNKKILLVNLSKGRLGDINANLLGMIIVGKILMAALSRVDALVSDLPPFYFYIDEFQNITTDSISAILSEARKYKLSLNIAHQFIAQLDPGIRDAVFGNVGSMVAFRTGAEDADFLENQFRPVFESQDIMNIENLNAYVKLLANGTPQKPFSIKIPFPPKGSPDRAAQIKQMSNQAHARKKEDVDREVRMRYGLG